MCAHVCERENRHLYLVSEQCRCMAHRGSESDSPFSLSLLCVICMGVSQLVTEPTQGVF